jgi:Cu/Ag efflux pump CusA
MVEQILLSHPEVVATARRTGRAEGDPHAMDVSASEMEVTLKMGERSKEAISGRAARDLASVPGTQIVIGQPISHRIDHMLSGNRSNIAVKIFGPDLNELRRLTGDIKAWCRRLTGAVDVSDEQQSDIPFLTLRFKREALARHGLSVRQVAETVETAFSGMAVSRVQQGQATYDLAVRFDPSATRPISTRSAPRWSPRPGGARCRLSALADIRNDRAPYYITRENVQRKMVVMANVAGRDWRAWWTTSGARSGHRSSCLRATTSSTAASSRAPKRPGATWCSSGVGVTWASSCCSSSLSARRGMRCW